MKQKVLLSIRGTQVYMDQEQDVIELVTEGTLATKNGTWLLQYEETELTGMQGVTTTFLIRPGEITLKRTGRLNSQMVFKEGVPHNSLYQMEFGALMMTVCATHMHWELSENGGSVDLNYSIEIEQTAAGQIDYHLDIRPIE